MTNPNMNNLMMLMFFITILNLLTKKTSIMCINLVIFIMMISLSISLKIKMTPMPFIMFLTMIGGLMIIFLYLTSTLWMKKENLTLKNKILMLLPILIPLINPTKFLVSTVNTNSMSIFNLNINNTTILMMILLLIMLMFVIEIHMKSNIPIRRKLKIWE